MEMNDTLPDNNQINTDRIKELKININRLVEEEEKIRSMRQELERELRSLLISFYTEHIQREIPAD